MRRVGPYGVPAARWTGTDAVHRPRPAEWARARLTAVDTTSGSTASPLLALAAAEEARARAARLTRDAARVEAALQAVERRAGEAAWSGPVREAFGNAVRPRRAALADAAADLRAEAARLEREAVGLERAGVADPRAGPHW